MSAEENKAIVRRYFEELWNKGDLSFIEEYIGPDVTHSWGHETRESWRVALSAWLTAFPDFRYHVDDLVAEGDTVAANTHFTATHRGVLQIGSWGPWAPRGKSVDVREANFFRLAGGKVVEIWVAWDTTTFARQLGVDLP